MNTGFQEKVGIVKNFNPKKGYGFATVEGREDDVWFHLGDYTEPVLRYRTIRQQPAVLFKVPKHGDEIIIEWVVEPKNSGMPKAYKWCYKAEADKAQQLIDGVCARANWWGAPWFVVFNEKGPLSNKHACSPCFDPKADYKAGLILRKYDHLIVYQDPEGTTWTEESMYICQDGRVFVNTPSAGYSVYQVSGIIPSGNPGFWYWTGKNWTQIVLSEVSVTSLLVKETPIPAYYTFLGYTLPDGSVLRSWAKRDNKHPWFYRARTEGSLLDDSWYDANCDTPAAAAQKRQLEQEHKAKSHAQALPKVSLQYNLDFHLDPLTERLWLLKGFKSSIVPKWFNPVNPDLCEISRGKITFQGGYSYTVSFHPGGWTMGLCQEQYRFSREDDLLIQTAENSYLAHAADVLRNFSTEQLMEMLGVSSVVSSCELPKRRREGYYLVFERSGSETTMETQLWCPHYSAPLMELCVANDIFGLEQVLLHNWGSLYPACDICGPVIKMTINTGLRSLQLPGIVRNEFGYDVDIDVESVTPKYLALAETLRDAYASPLHWVYITGSTAEKQGIYLIDDHGVPNFFAGPIKVLAVRCNSHLPKEYYLLDRRGHLVGIVLDNMAANPVYEIVDQIDYTLDEIKDSGMEAFALSVL